MSVTWLLDCCEVPPVRAGVPGGAVLRPQVPPDGLPPQPAQLGPGPLGGSACQSHHSHRIRGRRAGGWLVGLQENLTTLLKVTNYMFKYEPLYVAKAETPIFDERFIGFGMTRNTQVGCKTGRN